MTNRDDFSEKTRRALATRAGWHCSFSNCNKLTVGPSEESPESITGIGVAAHITAAAPGGRRYDPKMSPEERASIGNGIWLCADHSVLIDRDEVTYTADSLRSMKNTHEQNCARAVRTGNSSGGISSELLAVGQDIVCTAEISKVDARHWLFNLKHFIIGDLNRLISYIGSFATSESAYHYVLSNEIGDGRSMGQAPVLTKAAGEYTLTCAVDPAFERIEAQKIGSSLAQHPETGDLFVGANGDIARVSGVDAFDQKVSNLLSMQQGESVFSPMAGVRFFEYFNDYKGSPWLSLLLKLDVIRLASIPFEDLGRRYTPLQCVMSVRAVELLSEEAENSRLPIRLEFDVKGVGAWKRKVDIFMPTSDQFEQWARQRQANAVRSVAGQGSEQPPGEIPIVTLVPVPASMPLGTPSLPLLDRRYRLLKLFYDRKDLNDGWVPPSEVDIPIDRRAIVSGCEELASERLIVWEPKIGNPSTVPLGRGKITAIGTDVFDKRRPAPFAISGLSTDPIALLQRSQKLQIEFGETGGFFQTGRASGLYTHSRTLNLQLSNIHAHEAVTSCKVQILRISPAELDGPWLLKENFSLAAGDHEFIPLAKYIEPNDIKLSPYGDSFFEILTVGSRPLPVASEVHELCIRATAIGSSFVDAKCKLWVDETGRLRIMRSPPEAYENKE